MASPLPPGPRAPKLIQSIGWWKRPLSYLERCRARYGRRFTLSLVRTRNGVRISVLDKQTDRENAIEAAYCIVTNPLKVLQGIECDFLPA